MDEKVKLQSDSWQVQVLRYNRLCADNNPDGEEDAMLLGGKNSGNKLSTHSSQEHLGTSITNNSAETDWERDFEYSLLNTSSADENSSYSEERNDASELKGQGFYNCPAEVYGSLESWSSAQSSFLLINGENETETPSQQGHCAIEMENPFSETLHETVIELEQSTSSVCNATSVQVETDTGRPGERELSEPTGRGDVDSIQPSSDVMPVMLEDDSLKSQSSEDKLPVAIVDFRVPSDRDSTDPHAADCHNHVQKDDLPNDTEEKPSPATGGGSPVSSGSSGGDPLGSGGDPPGARGDPLGYDIYAKSIAEIVTDERTEMPLTVGVYGEWGMGKTYLLGEVKDEVNGMIDKKKKDYEKYYKGEVDGLKENIKRRNKRNQKMKFPIIHFSSFLVAFLILLLATIACAARYQNSWSVFLILTILVFVALVAVLIHAYARNIRKFCTKRIKLLQKANPMHWMVAVYLDWVEPPDMNQTPAAERYEVIWVDFNAWEFSACKVLWAGIVTKLCDAVEDKIGSTPARFYRVIKGQVEAGGGKKPLLQCAWFRLLLAVVLVVILASLAGIYVLAAGTMHIKALIAVITKVLGLAIVANIRNAYKVVKNLLKSQKDILNSRMQRPDFAEQLGFMSKVKSEVQTVTSLLRFLEHMMGIQYRVIIVVDDIDCCPGDRIVDVLQAMNIILSDEEANMISIIAMDPRVVVNCLESRIIDAVINNSSGYECLKRIVDVPVCLPEPTVEDRRQLFRTVVRGKGGIIISEYPSSKPGKISFKAGTQARQKLLIDSQAHRLSAVSDAPSDLEVQDGGREQADFRLPLLLPLGGKTLQRKESKEAELEDFALDGKEELNIDFLGDVIQALVHRDDDQTDDIMFYVHGNAHQIINLYHVMRMTVKVLKHRNMLQYVKPQQVASWVVLAEQWPYRLSWVLQFVDDLQQNAKIQRRCSHVTTNYDPARTDSLPGKISPSRNTKLYKVFEVVKPEMSRVDKEGFARLNNLDGDPEMFELLLVESKFTVQDVMTLLPCTINLNWSIQRRIAVARGLATD